MYLKKIYIFILNLISRIMLKTINVTFPFYYYMSIRKRIVSLFFSRIYHYEILRSILENLTEMKFLLLLLYIPEISKRHIKIVEI